MASSIDKFPDYEVVIGIEVHVQFTTKSKIFCDSPNQIATIPNTNICPVCAGHPGVLPVLNKEVVESAIKAGIATRCTIEKNSEFARKHYFYPDLPKNYQITQNDKPICTEGIITLTLEDGTQKDIRLLRIHMEEDAGKNIHATMSNESFVDLNRAGTPLLEMVSYPDISSSYEARAYLKTLRSIVMYLDICSGNMEDGAFRADTNISVRKKGATKLGTKCELKNINSFKLISDAIEYEIERQITTIEAGGTITQETRLWDTKERKTTPMRSKEGAADYRYFPDPDLPIVSIDDAHIEKIRASMPELPNQKFVRFTQQNNLTPYEAEILVSDLNLANYYEQAYKAFPSKLLINWVLRDIIGYTNDNKVELSQLLITPEKLAAIMKLLDTNVINNRGAQEIFIACAQTGKDPEALVQELGLQQIADSGQLESIIKDIVAQNPNQVAAYKSGKDKLFGFFVGQVMQKTKGNADPIITNDLLKKYLS